MKAVTLHTTGGPDVLKIENTPEPRPGPTEVIVKVIACGICGHDQADRAGLTHVAKPVILGHEISGIVTEVGDRVHVFRPGDRVACKQFTTCGWCNACRSGHEMECPSRRFNYGGWAEYATLSENAILKVPDEVDLVGAAVVACAIGSGLRALRHVARLAPGESVLVTGAGGGLGIHGLQVAKAMGARVIAVTSSPYKVRELYQYGADVVILARDDYWPAILDATGGAGVDVVLDNVGHPEVFGQCFRALARGGRYVFTGQIYRQKIELYPAFVFGKEAVITGSASTRMPEFIDAMELVRAGKVQTVVQQFPLIDVIEAHRQMDSHQVLGRAVLIP